MLYKISIENFFSIAEQQELILPVPLNAPDLPCFISSPSDKDIRLPSVVGIFGANASGKSTILRAIVSTALFAIASFDWQAPGISSFFQPYRQRNWAKKPTKICIEFDSQLALNLPTAKFRYELHVLHHPDNFLHKTISYEALFYAPKGKFRSLFERQEQVFHFGSDFSISNNDPRKESIRPDASVISTLAKLNHQPSIHLCKLVSDIQTNSIGFDKIQQSPNQWLLAYANDKGCLEQLNKELRRFDVGLEGMTIEQGNQGLFAKFTHIGLDDFIFLQEESAGTRRFIEIFLRLHYALKTGSIAVIDEIDTDLHPLLLPELLRWFNDSDRNHYGAQLLFTAHNPALLDDLEKEQIFFTEKLCGESTHVYGARDIKGLRREPSLMKKYLAGELGAVPHIG
ncbi:MAG: ATP-binding protein [Gammaproteobacteria bacterium]|nr:MAG: ATP-binding protein [Gammaproteobacteria bacterium]